MIRILECDVSDVIILGSVSKIWIANFIFYFGFFLSRPLYFILN